MTSPVAERSPLPPIEIDFMATGRPTMAARALGCPSVLDSGQAAPRIEEDFASGDNSDVRMGLRRIPWQS